MRDQWYGDNRDLVKWGVLLQLAEIHGSRKIIQVAYYRPSHWDVIDISGQSYPLPKPVIQHFRNIRNITSLTKNPEIQVLASTFSDRTAYMHEVLQVLAQSSGQPRVVFLDPDTGLASRKPNLAHVLDKEVADIWNALQNSEVLVFYQHQTNWNGKPWVEAKREQFEQAIGLPRGTAKIARASEIAWDVVFFYAKKSRPNPAAPHNPRLGAR